MQRNDLEATRLNDKRRSPAKARLRSLLLLPATNPNRLIEH
jgi:hypothetical protein